MKEMEQGRVLATSARQGNTWTSERMHKATAWLKSKLDTKFYTFISTSFQASGIKIAQQSSNQQIT